MQLTLGAMASKLTFDPPTRLSESIQNLIRSSHSHSTPSLKISCKSVQPFSRNVADKETKKQRKEEIQRMIWRKFKNLVLLIAVLAVDVAAVSQRHCAATISQQWRRLCSVRSLKPAMHILNKVFDSSIVLLASFVTIVDYSRLQAATSQQDYFCNFCPFGCG